MATYYNSDDLYARLTRTASWISSKANDMAKKLKYSGTFSNCCMVDLEFVVACLEAVECYTPITSDDEDGETNCLTEAELDQIFKNISTITGLAFAPKGFDYGTVEIDDNNQFATASFNSGSSLTLNNGNIMEFNKLTKEI